MKDVIPYQYCTKVGKKLLSRLKYKFDESIADISRIQIIFACIVANYNETHRKFGLTFCTDEQKDEFLVNVMNRINMLNPLSISEVHWTSHNKTRTPSERTWNVFALGDLHLHRNDHPIAIPYQPEFDIANGLSGKEAVEDGICGNFRLRMALALILVARKMELQERLPDFANHDEYLQACKEKPRALPVYTRMVLEQPQGWDEDRFGEFPHDGILLVFIKLPSSNKSMKNT